MSFSKMPSLKPLDSIQYRLFREIDYLKASKYHFFMISVDEIRNKIVRQEYEFSKHAVDQSIIRDISVKELEQALSNKNELVEDYPDDKYGPSCLVLGFTDNGRPLHIQCSYPERPLIKIITLYEPSPELWENFRIRNTD